MSSLIIQEREMSHLRSCCRYACDSTFRGFLERISPSRNLKDRGDEMARINLEGMPSTDREVKYEAFWGGTTGIRRYRPDLAQPVPDTA